MGNHKAETKFLGKSQKAIFKAVMAVGVAASHNTKIVQASG